MGAKKQEDGPAPSDRCSGRHQLAATPGRSTCTVEAIGGHVVTHLMDLVAGKAKEILLVIGLDDLAALDDRRRFPAHVALGGGLDPTWLDLFAEAVRA